MGTRVVAVLAVVSLAVACSGGGAPNGADPRTPVRSDRQPDIALAGALTPFGACEELLSYVTEHAVELVKPWGLGFGGDPAQLSAGADAGAQGGRQAGGSDTPVAGTDYSGTNVQETGVDEPDTVKTDGERMFLLGGRGLKIVDVSGAAPELLSVTWFGRWGGQLLLDGDRLLVLGDGAAVGRVDGSERSDLRGSSGTRLQLYDVADPTDPRLVSSLRLDGRVVSARLVDGVARVVLRAEPVGLPFVRPKGSGLRAEREAIEQNREIIRESTVENWVPYYVHEGADGAEDEGSLLSCDQVHRPTEFAGLGTTSVLSLDLAGNLSPAGSVGVLAGGETVYASTDRLYVATNRWYDWEALSDDEVDRASERYTTELHAFDITDPDAARYIGSGKVRGHVLNQWAMSAHDGVLRVATTEGSPWWGRGPRAPMSESFVTTFAERDGRLVQLGQVGGLGKGERIYAVRFMGDIGYVVTFRETDPLYTLDLSDPAEPRMLGELKILGYSAYLHPVGDDLVIGIGQDADKQGRTRGLQLSLFDVSDLANPRRIDKVTHTDAHSAAEWDHHAFLYWPETGHLVIPYESWSGDERKIPELGALSYTVDRENGLSEAGTITHVPEGVRDPGRAWLASIYRSVVVDDRLYTLSSLGILASRLDTLAEIGWLGY